MKSRDQNNSKITQECYLEQAKLMLLAKDQLFNVVEVMTKSSTLSSRLH
jgi:hypothetical protein